MKFGYARVSTAEQNVEQQANLLIETYGVPPENMVTEQFTGTTMDRPQFSRLVDKLRKGDELFVYHVSRLGRNTREVLELVETFKARGIKLIIHELGGMNITSPQGKLMLTMLAGLAEMEREYLKERQALGIARAKKEGKYKGRKALDEEIISTAQKLLEQGYSKRKAAKQLNIGESTLYKYLKADADVA